MSIEKNDNDVLPSVDISSGTVRNGPIEVGHQFEFSTSTQANNIGVSAPVNQPWFSPDSFSFNGPGSFTVTAELASIGGWGYGVTGMNRSNPNPRIPVGGGVPGQLKAS